MTKLFTRNIEDFECDNCGHVVQGNGYTNHCPKCLFSKHVDINPGDRNCECHGLMPVVSIEFIKGGYVLTHKCSSCGFTRRNKAGEDDIKAIIEWSKNQTP